LVKQKLKNKKEYTMLSKFVNKTYPIFLSEKRKRTFEKFIFISAILLFILHFSLIIIADVFAGVDYKNNGRLLNPISAIYTPFSLILLYEIYLLIYYLPHSITIYLGKQYEIIALIMIRKIFNNLSKISIGENMLDTTGIKELLLTFAGLLILFLLIFFFYRLSGNKPERADESQCRDNKSRKFFLVKKVMAMVLVLIFIFLFIRSFFEIKDFSSIHMDNIISIISKMNTTFFDTFFTALILTEVLLLLFTFELSDKFSKVIRNSGFIISTILLKLSFQTTGIINVMIILVAVSFGVAILGIHKLFEKKLPV